MSHIRHPSNPQDRRSHSRNRSPSSHRRSYSRHRRSNSSRRRSGSSRRRSRSHSRRHRKSRRRHRSRSGSSDQQLSGAVVKLIKDSIAEAFGNSDSQNPACTQGEESASMSKEIKELKKGQKELEVEKRISSLKTEGAQSQYRTIAFMGLKLDSAFKKIDELS